MAQLAIRGHATRGSEVIELLEMLGADRLGYKDTFVGFYYYIECGVIVSSDECPIDAIVFALEEFEKKFHYKVGDKVIYEDKIREITKMVWEEQTNTIAYKFDDKLYCNVINALQPYKEETMKEIKSIDLNKLERQLDEALAKETPESLNKWLDEENINTNNLCTQCVYAVDNHCGLRGFTNDFNRPYCSARNTDKLPNGFELQPDGYFSWVDSKPQYPKTLEKLNKDKFDITTLKPFDKVLVRQNVYGKWGIDFFGFYTEGYYYTTGSCIYVQCIPYEGNEHLLGTTAGCDEFYKTW